MPITDIHVGRSYPPTAPYEVSRAKIAEFAAALGDDNPAYAGADPVAPPTFGAVLAASAWGTLFSDPELGLSLARVVHADQSFTWTRPLHAGDRVSATLRIAKVRVRGATAIVTVAVTVTDAAGAEVCRVTSTLVHTAEEDAA